MASRKEQKEQARALRLAEEKERAAHARKQRRLRMIVGVVLAVVAIVAVAVAIGAGGGGGGGSNPAPTHPSANGVKLPAPKLSNLAQAAKAAGCTSISTPDSVASTAANRTHVNPGTKVHYPTNPPSYGAHFPTPASDGEYAPSHTPQIGFLVHAMEHGRIEYQYRPGLPAAEVKQLESLFNESVGTWAPQQFLLLFQNPTGMPYDVAATAWGHVLGCKTFNPLVFDALRDFRLTYSNKGPEQLGLGAE
ncbi:MAG: DUF3105 domain-containing protein [Solirubrobacteraceae bacterium]